ncbi:MAG: arsenite efflux transporter metallochaperone ArsD [Cellulosilyticaceae bacterium]
MKKIKIFDPAMCCSTGVCGPSVNPELLRMATVINNLKQKEIIIERYNLNQNPEVFLNNTVISELLNTQGVGVLPITMVDNEVIRMGSYLTNQEISELLEIPETYLQATVKRAVKKASGGCGCKGGCC